MIIVPESLKNEILKRTKRSLKARVRIDYSDANIDSTIVAWAGTTQEHTYLTQTCNGKEDVSAKYAMLGDGKWVLDGTWVLAPETEDDQYNYEIGWNGQEVSKPDGTFQNGSGKRAALGHGIFGDGLFGGMVSEPHLSVNFLPRTVSNVRISFDNARMEYAESFDVVFRNTAGAVLFTLAIVGNTGVKYIQAITPLNLVAQITIVINRWSSPRCTVKVAEIFTSVTETYNGADIIDMEVIENRELSDDGIPLGTTASGECVIQLRNRLRKFDDTNTLSVLYNLVRKGVRIRPEIGDGVNWIPLGVFYADSWDVPRRSLIATVTGLDRMAILDESEYKVNTIIQAPADETYLTDTTAEWAGGELDGCVAEDNALRMAFN
jgi:hypothetical protein